MKPTLSFLLLLLPFIGNTQIYEDYKHVPATVSESGLAGISIDVDGEWAAVGAPTEENSNYADQGTVHMYRRLGEQWVYAQWIQPPSSTLDFGRDVTIEGEWLAISAPDDETNHPSIGGVFIYRLVDDQWEFHQNIENDSPFPGGMRADIELNEERLAIAFGASTADSVENRVQLYVPLADTWTLDYEIYQSQPAHRQFGSQIELDGNDMIIGASEDYDIVNDGGAAYYYHFDGVDWIEIQKIYPEDIQEGAIAQVLCLDDGRLFYGRWTYDTSVTNEGRADMYTLVADTFAFHQTLPLPSGVDRFGTASDIRGDMMLVWVAGSDDTGGVSEGAYVPEPLIERFHFNERGYEPSTCGLFESVVDQFTTLGSIVIHLSAKGSMLYNSGDIQIRVEQLGFFIKDYFDFSTWQPLGFWNLKDKVASTSLQDLFSMYSYEIGNSDYVNYRESHGMGGDFRLYSTVHIEDLPTPLVIPLEV